MMRDRLGETDLLAHTLTVAGDLSMSGFAKIDAGQCFDSQVGGLLVAHAVQSKPVINELPAGNRFRERIKLSAITDRTEELVGIPGIQTHHVERAAGRLNQSRHQIHQSSLPRSIRSDQAGDSRRQFKRDAIDTQNLTVKLRHFVENDMVAHPRTTSRARMRAFNAMAQSTHMQVRAMSSAVVGSSYRSNIAGMLTCSKRRQRVTMM